MGVCRLYHASVSRSVVCRLLCESPPYHRVLHVAYALDIVSTLSTPCVQHTAKIIQIILYMKPEKIPTR